MRNNCCPSPKPSWWTLTIITLAYQIAPHSHIVEGSLLSNPAPQKEDHGNLISPPGYEGQPTNDLGQPTYGVDASFPIHYKEITTNYPWLPHNVDPKNHETPKEFVGMPIQPMGNKAKEYEELMEGCRKFYGKDGKRCDWSEDDRVAMSLRQPKSMQNYTAVGFKKIRAPEKVWTLLQKFWKDNKHKKSKENWPKGNTYTNSWSSPTYMVSVEDTSLRGGGYKLKQEIWDAARSTIQEWTGEELTQCSLYGIRVYEEDAILATHVDRLPLVSSAIINVAQDVDEPWPIEVYAHDGKAYNITMEPGDMVLYESHSVLHGRPFPLKGRFYANVFIHFEPTGHSLRHGHVGEVSGKNVDEEYSKAAAEGTGGHESGQHEEGLPVYIMENTEEAESWFRRHPDKKKSAIKSFATGSTPLHLAAQSGNLASLTRTLQKSAHLVNAKDENGWTPLHEGARGGHTEVVKVLVDKGAKLNERTQNGEGGTPLYWAVETHGESHPVVKFLTSVGALNIGPEL